jgi:hypothetical protein
VVWYDVIEHFPDGGAGAAAELRRQFCEMGVNTAWRRARPGDPYGEAGRFEIPVAILARHPLQRSVPRPIMGEVPDRWTAPGPRPVRVYVEGIRDALGLERTGSAAAELMRLAVGRVATHEMVHALAPRQGHAREGLMSSRLDRKALVGSPPLMSAGHVSAVRARLRIGGGSGAPAVAESVGIEPLYGGGANEETSTRP